MVIQKITMIQSWVYALSKRDGEHKSLAGLEGKYGKGWEQ